MLNLFAALLCSAAAIFGTPCPPKTEARKFDQETKTSDVPSHIKLFRSANLSSDCGKVAVSASFLLWQTKIWGLEFATKSFLPNVPSSNYQTFEEKLYVPDFGWRPGFRFILGGRLPYDNWDARLGWTIYKEECTSLKKHFDSVIAPPGIGIIPLWNYPFLQISGGNQGNPLRYGSAFGNWKMILNTLDIELGRRFLPEKSLPMRLLVGAKIANIKQHTKARYGQGTEVLAISPQGGSPSLFQYLSSKFRIKTYQWGIGPRVGLATNWHTFYGISLIGNGAFSILCSFFDLSSKYKDVIQPIPGETKMIQKENFHELTPICEAMLGLDWGICAGKNTYLGLQIGYEWQYWWSINHARRNYVQTLPGQTIDMRGEMQIQGLNGAIKVDF